MFYRQARIIMRLYPSIVQKSVINSTDLRNPKHLCRFFSTGLIGIELPRKLKKSERKPLVTSVNELKRNARIHRQERQEICENMLLPPDNGLLVKELVSVAYQVHSCRDELLNCVSKVVESIPVYSCSMCGEVHVGHPPHEIKTCNGLGSPTSKEHVWNGAGLEHIMPVVESFHLYDRVGRAVSHNEQLQVDRVPAVVELCIQAGVDILEYPTRRRFFPVYSIAGKIIDFEKRFPKEESTGNDFETFGFWGKRKKSSERKKFVDLQSDNVQDFAVRGMKAWEEMRSGVSKLMRKYAVQTCGYCSEVQVGPKGHRVRNCLAYKHQMRDGQHAWQEATVDDLIPPVHVWHVQNLQCNQPLINRLKRYYGKLPAVVELFAQAGALVGENYSSVMREDVVVPGLDEEKWVV